MNHNLGQLDRPPAKMTSGLFTPAGHILPWPFARNGRRASGVLCLAIGGVTLRTAEIISDNRRA